MSIWGCIILLPYWVYDTPPDGSGLVTPASGSSGTVGASACFSLCLCCRFSTSRLSPEDKGAACELLSLA